MPFQPHAWCIVTPLDCPLFGMCAHSVFPQALVPKPGIFVSIPLPCAHLEKLHPQGIQCHFHPVDFCAHLPSLDNI